MKRTLTEMKTRLDLRLRENQRLQEERDRLEDVLAKTKGELNQIQSQVPIHVPMYTVSQGPIADKPVRCFRKRRRVNLTLGEGCAVRLEQQIISVWLFVCCK